VPTSIESLAPSSAIFPVMLKSHHLPSVKYHNIVGKMPKEGLIGHVVGASEGPGGGDGVVSFGSAHLDDVESEIVVPSDHVNLHRHPRSVLEVHRILLEHLDALNSFPHRIERLPRTTGLPPHANAPALR